MTKKKNRPRKHLDIEERRIIEEGLNDRKTFTWIATRVGVEISSVRREILRNRRRDGSSGGKSADRTDCSHLKACKIQGLCGGCLVPKRCKNCYARDCWEICGAYEKRACLTVEKAPLVCNACNRYPKCALTRWKYSAEFAQKQAVLRGKESREGIDLTEEEVGSLVGTVRAGLARGQSIHHIFESNGLPCSERSFYRHVENQTIPIKSIDLAKKVKYKKRKRAKAVSHETGFFAGHEYEDYLELSDQDRARVTEMDTVLGKRGEKKCVLTLHRVDLHFQIYLLLKDRTMESVVNALDWLEERCEGRFTEFFGLILADRGSEFDDIAGIEKSRENDGARCAVYFADPQRSDQRGAGEKNHVEFRKIVPKGTSLEKMTADTLAEICSHVNSSIRKGCGNASPMQMATLCMPSTFFENLGLKLIPPNDVIGAPGILYRP